MSLTVKEYDTYFHNTFTNSTSSFLSGYMLMLFDILGLFLCIGFSFFVVNLFNNSILNFRSFIYYSVYFPPIVIVYFLADLYPGIMVSPPDEARRLAICNTCCFAAICASIILNERVSLLEYTKLLVADSSRRGVIYSFIIANPITIVGMVGIRDVGRHIYGHFSFWGVPAVIFCTGDSGKVVIKRLARRKYLGYHPCLVINSSATTSNNRVDGVPIFPPTSEILKEIKALKIKVAVLCDYEGNVMNVFNSFRYTIFISKNQLLSTGMQVRDLGGILGFSIAHNLTWKSNLFIKRCIDLLLIIVSLPLTIPVMTLTAIGVKLTSPGPVFFAHKRIGKNGKELKCLKFRSMYRDSAAMLEKILREDPVRRAQWEEERKFIDDPRVTPFGKFLRKTSLDELPQLFNIFLGQMSFVGPRPVTSEELEKYGENANFVLSVTPGLSGMWQISGRSDTGYEERIVLDTYYIQNWSIWLDLWIIVKTIWVVLRGSGAY